MSSVFTKIINGEIESKKVFENEMVFAFLDINPEATGHCLIVPKIEIDMWQNVPENYFLEVMKTAQKLAPKILKAVEAERIFLKVIGTDVPHFHLHLIPFKAKMNEKKLDIVLQKIVENLDK